MDPTPTGTTAAQAPPVLDVRNLTTAFQTPEGRAVAVHNVSFTVSRGETLGIVGESGCGKTVTALSILHLLPAAGRIESGNIFLCGEDLRTKSESELRELRGNRMAMIFQEPLSSLNPVFTVGAQIEEVYLHHLSISRQEARARSLEIMQHVGIPHPAVVSRAYPHELSGGLRQRALIAMSLACIPELLIADEPTTAIDVTVQMQILLLIERLKNEFGMAVLFITHDLGVVAESCDDVAVMYASNIVEYGPVVEIFRQPRHPYTVGLLQSLPIVHQPRTRLSIIQGQVPRPTHYPRGCHFTARCGYATEQCALHEPPLERVSDGHVVACWNRANVVYDPPVKPSTARGPVVA